MFLHGCNVVIDKQESCYYFSADLILFRLIRGVWTPESFLIQRASYC